MVPKYGLFLYPYPIQFFTCGLFIPQNSVKSFYNYYIKNNRKYLFHT